MTATSAPRKELICFKGTDDRLTGHISKKKKVNMFLYFLECRRANLIFSSSHPAHQDQRGKLSGGQTDSISSVDPQQVIGSYIQVMVTMGGGKHTHLFTEVRN